MAPGHGMTITLLLFHTYPKTQLLVWQPMQPSTLLEIISSMVINFGSWVARRESFGTVTGMANPRPPPSRSMTPFRRSPITNPLGPRLLQTRRCTPTMGILHANLVVPPLSPDLVVPGHAHPNQRVHGADLHRPPVVSPLSSQNQLEMRSIKMFEPFSRKCLTGSTMVP